MILNFTQAYLHVDWKDVLGTFFCPRLHLVEQRRWHLLRDFRYLILLLDIILLIAGSKYGQNGFLPRMTLKGGHNRILRDSIILLGSQIGALRLHLSELKDPRSLGLIEVQMLLSIKEGLAHIHFVGPLIASWVMLEVNHPCVLRA